jgi:L-malate glycosyltransferase
MNVITAPVPAIESVTPAVRAGDTVRVLVVTDTPILGPGGSERFLCNLLGNLDAPRFKVDVVQLCDPPSSGFRESPGGDHIVLEYHPIDAVYGRRALGVYRELARRVREGRYDIVQSQHEKSDILCALLPRGPRAPLRISNRRDTGFQKGRLIRAGFRVINHRFDRVIAPSRAILDGLVRDERVRADRTQCLPNGVDTERFSPVDPAERSRLRAALGLPPHAFLFGCVARLRAVKRHCDMLDGFALATADRPDASLVLIGNGELADALRAQARLLGIENRVLFLGDRDDVESLLPLLDAFVLTSSTEGMSNAVLEAMACGLPTIATAVGGNPETVDAPSTGLLVPAYSPQSVAKAMRELLADVDRAREMGRRARLRVERVFSIEAMVAGFCRMYGPRGERA